MKMPYRSVTSFVFLFVFVVFSKAGTEIEVLRNRVNLRSQPDENSEVVCQVSAGDKLISIKSVTDEEWVQVLPPSKASLWIFAELVHDGTVAASRVNVRCGPGINYRTVGKMQKGNKVVSRGAHKSWLKIAPPEGSSLWIHESYIAPVDKKVVKKDPPKPVLEKPILRHAPVLSKKSHPGRLVVNFNDPEDVKSMPRPVVMVSGESGEKVSSAGGSVLASSNYVRDDIFQPVTYEGVLRPSGFVWRRPSKYRLVQYNEQGNPVILCYIKGFETKLESLIGRQVTVTGKELWVQGVRYSVLEASSVIPK